MPCRQVFAGRAPQPGTSGTTYISPLNLQRWNASEAASATRWLSDAIVGRLRVELPTAPGSGRTREFTLRINNADTAVSVTFTDTDTAKTASATVAVSRNDFVSLKHVASNSPTASGLPRITLEFDGSVAGESCYGGDGQDLGSNATMRQSVFTPTSWTTTGELFRWNLAAAAGDLKELAVDLQTAPGGSDSHAFALYLNGVKQDGSGGTVDTTFSITGSATSGAWSGTLALSPEDYIHLECVSSSVPTTSSSVVSARFIATTDGESQFAGRAGGNLAAGVLYAVPSATDFTHNATESLRDVVCGVSPFTLRGLCVRVGANSASTEKHFRTRLNGTTPSGAPTVSMIGSVAVNGRDASGSLDLVEGDRSALELDITVPGVANFSRWSWVQYALADGPITGSLVAGVNTTVKATRAIAFGLDGATNVHDEPGVFKVFGHESVTGYLELEELTAPAGVANKGRIWAEDNGSGKTRLMVQFGSGSPVQIAIEP